MGRHAALLQALVAELGDEIDFAAVDSGLHVALAFRNQVNDRSIEAAALKKGVEIRALSRLYAPQESVPFRQGTPSGLLLGFASVPLGEIGPGVKILRDVLQECRAGG